METIILTAPDISCDHCKNTIEKTVGALDGVQHVAVAVEPKQVTVQFDPAKVNRAQIVGAMDEEGYPVEAGG
ncbi:MAG: heavy-metal-associated domain-containing protein [Dehalococcoidia bacterium]